MQKTVLQQEVLCNKCLRMIKQPHYLIHQIRCNGNHNRNKTKKGKLNRENFKKQQQSQLIDSSNESGREFSNKINKKPQFIPCVYCGHEQQLNQLDTHPEQCQHREQQCTACRSKFPISLMEEHRNICPERRRRTQRPIALIERRYSTNSQQSSLESVNQSSDFSSIHQGGRDNYVGQWLTGLLRPRSIMQTLILNQLNYYQEHSTRQLSHYHRNLRFFRLGRIQDFLQLVRMLAYVVDDNGDRTVLGMTKAEIKALECELYVKKQGEEQPQICTICYCNMEEGEKVTKLKCKHIYHPDCIDKWLEINCLCPVCKRNQLKEEEEQSESRTSSQQQ